MARLAKLKTKDGIDIVKLLRVARHYERELKRIKAATACIADRLREFAAAALKPRKS
jgi:hypothetical protein